MPPEAATIEKPNAAPAAPAPVADAPKTAAPSPADPGKIDVKPAADAKPAEAKPEAKPAAKDATSKAPAAPSDDVLYGVDDDDGDGAKPEGDAAPAKEGEEKAEGPAIPENWRELAAGGDDKLLATLKRYGSLQSVMKAFQEQRKKISSGEFKKGLPENPSPEELAAYREAHGIPKEPAGYDTKVDGIEFRQEDKPVIDGLLAELHETNAPPATIKKLIAWYGKRVAEVQEQKEQELRHRDYEDIESIQERYRPEWGPDFKANQTLINRALKDPEVIPPKLGEALKHARLPDGTRLVNHIDFPGFMAGFARERYGDGGLITGETGKALATREAELVKMMKEDSDAYYMGRNSKGQTFADELLEIRRTKESGGSRRRA